MSAILDYFQVSPYPVFFSGSSCIFLENFMLVTRNSQFFHNSAVLQSFVSCTTHASFYLLYLLSHHLRLPIDTVSHLSIIKTPFILVSSLIYTKFSLPFSVLAEFLYPFLFELYKCAHTYWCSLSLSLSLSLCVCVSLSLSI